MSISIPKNKIQNLRSVYEEVCAAPQSLSARAKIQLTDYSGEDPTMVFRELDQKIYDNLERMGGVAHTLMEQHHVLRLSVAVIDEACRRPNSYTLLQKDFLRATAKTDYDYLEAVENRLVEHVSELCAFHTQHEAAQIQHQVSQSLRRPLPGQAGMEKISLIGLQEIIRELMLQDIQNMADGGAYNLDKMVYINRTLLPLLKEQHPEAQKNIHHWQKAAEICRTVAGAYINCADDVVRHFVEFRAPFAQRAGAEGIPASPLLASG